MTLLNAHKLLIATATLFCAAFALRELFALLAGEGKMLVLLASGAAACGLGSYLQQLWPRSSFADSNEPPTGESS
ncbi:MAG TPA: hypothetical protein DIU15_07005 [Deltaproteobacteria bacterium]|nr:hypothetical protein [Deltaproteobacteria bacterium]HCP45771.1 hypothetical protein [Deltaproteobacteria bacterium]|tara:strand:+ start:40 stop:264 length:225 start_codon:yes stop_codon:yes gene_type:complete